MFYLLERSLALKAVLAPLHAGASAYEYLSFKFGDYMTLPPEPQRKTHPISRLIIPEEK